LKKLPVLTKPCKSENGDVSTGSFHEKQ